MKHERTTIDEEMCRNLGWGRRKSLRRHFGYPGQIHVENGGSPRACTIIDMSETGAQLDVPGDAPVPNEFSLLIGGNSHVRRHCRVVWRSGTRMGVEFRAGVKEGGARGVQRVVLPV